MSLLALTLALVTGCSGAGASGGGQKPFVPQLAVRPLAAAAPSHVLTFLYYNQSFGSANVNAGLSPSFMAAHADFIETSGFDNTDLNNFKAAGGKFGGTYIDPTYVPYCVPPFSPPAGACAGQVGNLNPPEDSWFHGSDGSRVRRFGSYTGEYQEFLNPGSADARAAVVAWMNGYISQSPSLDFFFSDDSGSTFSGADGTPATGMFGGFNTAGVEITTDAAWISAENSLFSAAPRGLIINGGDGFKPAYNGVFLQNSNVLGANHEGCFNSDYYGGPVGSANNLWQTQADGLLADLPFHKYSLCMMNGNPTVAARLYALASWWLTYDQNYSVAAPIAPASDGNAVFPEFDIVPLEPKTTAGSDIGALYDNGVYVREFSSCFQAGVSIGPCAAVVNPSSSTQPIPQLSTGYTQELALNSASTASGGQATWVSISAASSQAKAERRKRRPSPTPTPAPIATPTPAPSAAPSAKPSPTPAPVASLGTLGPMQAIILRQ